MVNNADVLAVPVVECGEPLELVEAAPGLRPLVRPTWRRWLRGATPPLLRSGAHERLRRAASALPSGVDLVLLHAYRPLHVQQERYGRHVRGVLQEHPGLSLDEARDRATRYVADPARYAPHLTGGAVDVTLADGRGRFDMGNRLAYTATARTDCEGLTAKQAEHRALLVEAMTTAGLVNYSEEWWHWSYGDKYWGYVTGQPAIYGHVVLPLNALQTAVTAVRRLAAGARR